MKDTEEFSLSQRIGTDFKLRDVLREDKAFDCVNYFKEENKIKDI